MSTTMLLSISALAAMAPAAVLPYRGGGGRATLFWALLAVAAAGPLLWMWVEFMPGWRTGLAAALWSTIAATLVLFAAAALIAPGARNLAALLLPYLFVLGVLATIWQDQPEQPLAGALPGTWIELHIVFSVISYSLLTLAAVSGLAAFLRDRAMNTKRSNAVVELMPSIADAEKLQVGLLGICAAILALGVVTGMALTYFATGAVLEMDHKTILSLATLAVIVGLLLAHWRSGVRGRRAARLVLLAYLLLTLGYPGVKFVTDVLLA